MRTTKLLLMPLAIAALTFLHAAPASANDASIAFHGATVSYTDLTDNLCVNAADDFAGLEDYALGYIENAAGTILYSVSDTEGGGKSCTGNLSIPEDKLYYLQVFDCSRVPGTDCGGSPRKSFYS